MAFVAEQLAPLGARVVESAELPERSLPEVRREVDTLVECRSGDRLIRTAFEARDRSRRSDIQWIDELIGKYRDLDVDSVVAVSASGFSDSAQQKARAHNIELMSYAEASEADWSERFVALGVARTVFSFKPDKFLFHTEPLFAGKVTRDHQVVADRRSTHGGVLTLTLREFKQQLIDIAAPGFRLHLSRRLGAYYKTLADLRKNMVLEKDVEPTGCTLLGPHGSDYSIQRITLRVRVEPQREIVDVSQRTLGDYAMVTSASVQTLRDPVQLAVVQPEGSKPAKVFCEPGARNRTDPVE